MSISTTTTKFGEQIVAKWVPAVGEVVAHVAVSVAGGTYMTAFSLPDESSLVVMEDASGRWWIIYADGDGTPVRRYSDDRGATWTVRA